MEVVERAQAAIGRQRKVGEGDPGFILFHAPFSICSEKVRTTLHETGIPFVSHEVQIQAHENYHPDYVAVRLLAWKDMGEPPMVAESEVKWNGGSSLSATGFDPCVVPTLVDVRGDVPKVIVDSKLICEYLAATPEGEHLIPKDPAAKALAEKHIKMVDETPHVALLYDGIGEGDARPYYMRVLLGASAHQTQVDNLKKRLSEEGATWSGNLIKRAYTAKLNKTVAGEKASSLVAAHDTEYQKQCVAKMMEILRAMDEDLAKSSGDWLTGSGFTLADIFAGVSLHRLLLLGDNQLYDDLSYVKAFEEKSFARTALQDEVLFYPGMLPSYHMSALCGKYKGPLAGFMQDRKTGMLNAMAHFKSMTAQT